MNILQYLRRPYVSFFLSGLILLVACEQYDHDLIQSKQIIDYSAYFGYKEKNIDISALIKKINYEGKSTSSSELSRSLEREMNEEFNTDLNIPEEFHDLTNENNTVFLSQSKANNWITNEKEDLINDFYNDYLVNGSEIAISNYEARIVNMNLSEVRFEQETLFLNALKSLEDEGVFDSASQFKSDLNKSSGACIWALLVLVAALASLLICTTGILCAFAAIGYISAGQAVVRDCGGSE